MTEDRGDAHIFAINLPGAISIEIVSKARVCRWIFHTDIVDGAAMTLLLVWTLAFWVVNEAADALSFSNDYIGNHAELFDYTQDRQVIRPMSFTTVKQFLDQLGWVHSKDGWYPGYLSSANVVDPEGRTNTSVLQVTYGPGYFGQSTALGIAGWYSAPGYPYWNVTRMTLEYEVFFPTGFIFVKEGKLPGIWGADGISSTTFDCGGGSVNRSNPNCFSTRLMWRNATGAGAAYIYAVNNQAYCPSPTICPNSQVLTCCDPSYGDIVGRNFALLTGQWQKLAVMVDLQDGLTQVIHNGKVVISYIVKYGSIRLFNGIKFDTFFGGGSSSFSSPTTQYSYFRNFKLFVASTSRSYGQVKRSTSKTANSPAKTSRKSLASAQTSKKKTLGPVKTSMKKAMGTAKTSKKRTVIANGPKSTSKKRAATVKAPTSRKANTSRKSLASAQTSKKKTMGLVKTSMKKALGTAKASIKRTVIANGPKSTSKKRAATVKAPAKSSNNIHQAPPVASTRKRSHVVVRSRSTAPARMPMTSKTESANPLAVGSNSGHQNFPSATSYVFVLLGLAIIYVF